MTPPTVVMLLMLASLLIVGTGYVMAARDASRARESAAARAAEVSRTIEHAIFHERRADEYHALYLEERALSRELMAQLRTPTINGTPMAASSDEAEPLTVTQADRMVVEAERRRQELASVAALRRMKTAVQQAKDAEASQDLSGLEPVAITDDEATPVPRLTESYGGEEDEDDDGD